MTWPTCATEFHRAVAAGHSRVVAKPQSENMCGCLMRMLVVNTAVGCEIRKIPQEWLMPPGGQKQEGRRETEW